MGIPDNLHDPSDYANMSAEQLRSEIQDLHLLIEKEKEGCHFPTIFMGEDQYRKQLKENLKAAEDALTSLTGETPPSAPGAELGIPATGGPWWSRPVVVAGVALAGVLVVGGVAEGVFNFPINIRTSQGGSHTSGTNPNVVVATELPTTGEVCDITPPDWLNSVISPLTIPFGAGNPTKETQESKSKYVRCEFVVGKVGDAGFTDLIFTYFLYDPSKPLDTSKLQPVPDLGDDAFFSGPNKYNNYTLTSHKSKLVVTTFLSRKESADDALKQEKATQKQVYDWFMKSDKYKGLVG
jgi:hypothetical protein